MDTTKYISEQEFASLLSEIASRAQAEAFALVQEARDGLNDDQPVEWASNPNWERAADRFAETCGFIYDRLHGRGYANRKMSKKLRKALGYNG